MKIKSRKLRIFLFLMAGFLSLVFVAYIYVAYLMPLPDQFLNPQQIATSKIYDRNGVLLYEILNPKDGRKTTISLDDMPDYAISATLAAEDIAYYNHGAVDAGAIVRAIYLNARHGRIVSGASTITQQLVRNMLGVQQKRSYSQKLKEIAYAVRLSKIYTKDEILELYLNKIYYGNLAYGIDAASLEFFDKHVYDLDLAETAFLAGLPQSPSRYNPHNNFVSAKKRQEYVLEQMLKHSLISQSDFDEAMVEKLFLKANIASIEAPHFVHMIIQELEEEYGEELVHFGGLEVYTTLDINYQNIAEDIATRHIARLDKNNVSNAALVAMDVETGQVLAWLGSADYFDDEIDGAVDILRSMRQPGSSIKPFNYLLALENGYTPATIITDIPVQFETDLGAYSPKNYDLDYHGMVRLREALASSLNIPAVKVLHFNTPATMSAFLGEFGIELDKSPEFYGLALTLGGAEVRLAELAEAYLGIANYGRRQKSVTILSVKDHKGDTLQEWQYEEGEMVLGSRGEQHAFQIIDILSDPDARLIGFGQSNVLELSRPAAVKTGTTRNFKDNITVGFTPELLVATWIGNADATSMHNITGVDGAAPIWNEFIETVLKNKPASKFKRPSKMIELEICELSGLLPTEHCKNRVYEWFVEGSEPTEPDNIYQERLIDLSTNLDVTDCVENPDAPQISREVFMVFPAEMQEWALDHDLPLPPPSACSASDTGLSQEIVEIISPSYNDEFLIDSNIPMDNQRLPFKVAAPSSYEKVEWILNNESIATIEERPFTHMWKLESGKHSLHAILYLNNGDITRTEPTIFYVGD